jgi:hypothetical protein
MQQQQSAPKLQVSKINHEHHLPPPLFINILKGQNINA